MKKVMVMACSAVGAVAVCLAAFAACSSTSTPSPVGDASVADGGTGDSGCSTGATGCVAPCISAGGSCIGVSECSTDKGHLGDYSCGSAGASIACCFTPATSCGGAETFGCCAGGAVFRPTCKDGALGCAAGQTKCGVDGG